MKYKSFAAAVTALASSALFVTRVEAQICTPAAMPTNGCSVPLYAQLVDPAQITAFSALFSSSCNRHDTCYQTLGASRSACDDQFRGDMRAQCDSAFNRWLNPAGWEYCRQVGAEGYYTAVRNYGAPYFAQDQSTTLGKATTIRNQVDAEQCGMTASRTNYYSGSLMSYVSNAFATRTGRGPTTFEMFDGLHAADPSGDPLTWQTAVNSYASSRASVPAPSVAVSRVNGDDSVTLNATATPAGSPVTIKINGSTYGSSVVLDTHAEMYQSAYYQYQGFALARSSSGSSRELSLIDISASRRPICDPICP